MKEEARMKNLRKDTKTGLVLIAVWFVIKYLMAGKGLLLADRGHRPCDGHCGAAARGDVPEGDRAEEQAAGQTKMVKERLTIAVKSRKSGYNNCTIFRRLMS